MDYINDNSSSLASSSFDNDFNQPNLSHTDNLFHQSVDVTEAYVANHPINGKVLHLQYEDPLKYSSSVQFESLDIKLGNKHFVTPHEVSGYSRQDGTTVEGYYRDGDGDTTVNRTVNQGGGYFSK